MATEKDVSQDSLAPADLALRLQRQLDAAQQVTHIGSWDWDLATGHVTWSDELYRIFGLEPRKVEISLEGFLARVHPDDRERVQREVSAAVQRGGRFAHRERIVQPDGSVRELDTVGDVLVDTQGRPVTVIGTCHDITDDPRERAQRLQAGERRALEMLAAGAPLPEILAELSRLIEEMLPGTVTSILLMDSGTRVKNDNAPSLPDTSKLAVHGIFLGSPASSSDTALFRREPVFVTDIETDPRWEPYRDMARPYGLRACWSYPILAADGHPLGTFAVYYLQPRPADAATTELVARVAHVTGIAIERRQLDERLRALSERTEAIREDERTRIAHELHGRLGSGSGRAEVGHLLGGQATGRQPRGVRPPRENEAVRRRHYSCRPNVSRPSSARASSTFSGCRRRSSRKRGSSPRGPGSRASCAPDSTTWICIPAWLPRCFAFSRRL